MTFQPLFLSGASGDLFAIHHPPAPGAPDRGSLVYVPPFAEETNQSRRVVALQARRLAAAGVGTLLLDLYGTGDSAGALVDARWHTWIEDVVSAARWLERQGCTRVGLWGLRLGTLLAMEAASELDGLLDRMVLWQPVNRGQTHLTQFLRVQIAASMGQSGPGETTATLRAALRGGEPIEVAGYILGPELAAAMDRAELSRLVPPRACRIDCLEVVSGPEAPASAGTRKAVAAWRETGAAVSLETVVGPPFWALQDSVLAPALLDATSRLLEEPAS